MEAHKGTILFVLVLLIFVTILISIFLSGEEDYEAESGTTTSSTHKKLVLTYRMLEVETLIFFSSWILI